MARVLPAMLIRDAEVSRIGRADVRLAGERIAAVGQLDRTPGEAVIEANGGLLLPGLHDHHLHLNALAAARASLCCGPPEVTDAAGLAQVLASAPGDGWLRGVGYHESVAGMLDARTLDRWAPHRPVRIQHRSGRMWFLNTQALERLLAGAAFPPGLEQERGVWTGRLFDEDRWLRQALDGSPPSLATVGATLAAAGVTGVTDMSPANDHAAVAHFAAERAAGHLPQRCIAAGTLELAHEPLPEGIGLGPAKLHLHDAALPDYEGAISFIASAHRQNRAVAIHCTTEGEMVFALSTLAEAGPRPGDRIEHAGVAPDPLVAEIGRLKLQVVTQPHFIAERGDRYLRDVEPDERPYLYRAAAFHRAGVVLAGGSDAPFGSPDPWAAMRAAVTRRTAEGALVGVDEALSPEEALALYLADPLDLSIQRRIEAGAPADLCLLDRPWAEARSRLLAGDVRLVLIGGAVVHQRVDQPPLQRGAGGDPAA